MWPKKFDMKFGSFQTHKYHFFWLWVLKWPRIRTAGQFGAECDVPVSGIPGTGNSRYREFFIFLVVSEPVSEKIGTGKKYRNRYRKIWYRKKYRNWYRKKINIKKGFVFLSNLVILIFLHRIFFLNPITKCKFLFIIMKFFSKAKLDDDIYSMPNKRWFSSSNFRNQMMATL